MFLPMEVHMKHVEYKTQNTCARVISFDITDDNKITNLQFLGGCNGNLKVLQPPNLVKGRELHLVWQR